MRSPGNTSSDRHLARNCLPIITPNPWQAPQIFREFSNVFFTAIRTERTFHPSGRISRVKLLDGNSTVIRNRHESPRQRCLHDRRYATHHTAGSADRIHLSMSVSGSPCSSMASQFDPALRYWYLYSRDIHSSRSQCHRSTRANSSVA